MVSILESIPITTDYNEYFEYAITLMNKIKN